MVETETSAVDEVLEVFSDTCLEGSFTQAVTATAVLVHRAILCRQLAIDTRLIVGTEAESSILQLRDFGEVISIDVHHTTGGVLAKDHSCSTAVFGDQRPVEGGRRHQRSIALMLLVGGVALTEACAIAQRFARDDIDDTADSVSTEERRAPTTYDFDTLDHRSWDLFQPIDTSQRAEDRTAVDEDLRVSSFEPVDTHLVEAAVLAVVFDTQTGLEAKALAEVLRVGLLEDLLRKYRDKTWCVTAKGFLTVSRDDDPIEVDALLTQIEIEVTALPSFEADTAFFDTIAHETSLDRVGTRS